MPPGPKYKDIILVMENKMENEIETLIFERVVGIRCMCMYLSFRIAGTVQSLM